MDIESETPNGNEECKPSRVYPEPVEGDTLSEAILRTPKYDKENLG